MHQGSIKAAWLAVMVGMGAMIGSSDAIASGFAIRENCAETLGTVFAGAGSLADEPCTVFNNPAGMTRLSGNQIEVGATAMFPTINFHGTDTAGGNTGNNGGRTAFIPNLYGVTDITPDLKLGLAVTAPFGLPIKYNSAWAGRYLAIQAQALTVDVNPNIAYKINNWLSVAAGVSMQYLTFTLSNAVNQSAAGAGDALARFKGDNWGVGYNFGVLLEPIDGTRVGLTYRSKIDHKLTGNQNFLHVDPAFASALVSSGARVDISLPASWGVSVTHTLTPALDLVWDAQYTQWSSFKGVGIDAAVRSFFNESYRDSWFTALGLIYHLNDAWTLRGGAGWDQSPVQNRYRDVAVPDQDRYMLGFGVGYKITPSMSIDAAYAHYFASPASMNDSINNTAPVPGTLLTTQLQGTYQLSIDAISLGFQIKF
jgi:long-chain fatty acid transport protein